MKVKQAACSVFIYTAIALLVVLALAKLISSGSNAKILAYLDPVFLIPNRFMLWIASGLEITVVLICISTSKRQMQALAVAWLSTNFLLYRLGLWQVGYGGYCLCLGTLEDGLYISPWIADVLAKIIFSYLLIGSYATLLWTGRHTNKALTSVQNESGKR